MVAFHHVPSFTYAGDLRKAYELGAGQLLQRVMDLPRVGQHLNDMEWVVFTLANGKRNFLTSDKPVILPMGLQHNEAYVGLPISPNKLFVAANDRATLSQIQRMPAGDLTQNCNHMGTTQAVKFVYGTDDYQINFVDKRLRSSSPAKEGGTK